MRNSALLLVVSGMLMIASPALVQRLHPQRYVSVGQAENARATIQNRSAIGFILGQIRTSVSDMMFMKTEIYLHEGVRFAPHLDVNAMESEGKIQSEDAHEPHDEGVEKPGEEHREKEALTSLIPTEADDFRGFIGRLERDIKPWRDPRLPDKHSSGDELLPWYRMMTLADPNNVRGYMIGAWWLMTKRTDATDREALTFLDEGVRNNPDSFQLLLSKARVLSRLNRTADVIAACERARQLAIKQRPPGGEESDQWTSYMEDDFRQAVSMEAFSLRNEGRLPESRRVATETLEIMPEFEPLQKLVKEIDEGHLPPAPR